MSICDVERAVLQGQLWGLNSRLDKLYKSPVDEDERDDQFCALLEIVRELTDTVEAVMNRLEDVNGSDR